MCFGHNGVHFLSLISPDGFAPAALASSLTLPTSAFPSILSEAWLLNFLRLCTILFLASSANFNIAMEKNLSWNRKIILKWAIFHSIWILKWSFTSPPPRSHSKTWHMEAPLKDTSLMEPLILLGNKTSGGIRSFLVSKLCYINDSNAPTISDAETPLPDLFSIIFVRSMLIFRDIF